MSGNYRDPPNPHTLVKLRTAKGLKQATLVSKTKLSLKTIWKLENGKCERVHVKTLRLIAEALDVEIDDLYKITVPDVYIGDINTIGALGWDVHRLLEEMIELDMEVYEGLTPEEEGSAAHWSPVFNDYPQTWRVLINSEQAIVGYWHFVCLPDDVHRDLRQGSLSDTMITADRVRTLLVEGRYDIYFASMVLHRNYRGPRYFSMLLSSVLDVWTMYAENNIFFNEICTNAYTDYGDSICRDLEFTYVCRNFKKGKIYVSNVAEILKHKFVSRHHGRLNQFYKYND